MNRNTCLFCRRWKPRGNLACDRCLELAERRFWLALALFIPAAAGAVTWWKAVR